MWKKSVLYLYSDRVVTKHRKFPIQKVLGMSYKEIAGKGGLLYLHTLRAVYSYIVKASPHEIIDALKNDTGFFEV